MSCDSEKWSLTITLTLRELIHIRRRFARSSLGVIFCCRGYRHSPWHNHHQRQLHPAQPISIPRCSPLLWHCCNLHHLDRLHRRHLHRPKPCACQHRPATAVAAPSGSHGRPNFLLGGAPVELPAWRWHKPAAAVIVATDGDDDGADGRSRSGGRARSSRPEVVPVFHVLLVCRRNILCNGRVGFYLYVVDERFLIFVHFYNEMGVSPRWTTAYVTRTTELATFTISKSSIVMAQKCRSPRWLRRHSGFRSARILAMSAIVMTLLGIGGFNIFLSNLP